MNFDEIFDKIRNRTWIPISDTELVDMIVNANMNGTIDDEEKDLLLEMVQKIMEENMTNYDKIRNMQPIDLAIYLTKMREKAIDDYEEQKRYPMGIAETLHMLNEEVIEKEEGLKEHEKRKNCGKLKRF